MKRVAIIAIIIVIALPFSLLWQTPAGAADRFDKINSYVQKGIQLADSGDYTQAVSQFDLALQLAWKSLDSSKGEVLLSYIYFMRGTCYQAEDKFARAADDYLRVLYFTPRKGLDPGLSKKARNLIKNAADGLNDLPRELAEKRRDLFVEKLKSVSAPRDRSAGRGKEKIEKGPENRAQEPGPTPPATATPVPEEEWDF